MPRPRRCRRVANLPNVAVFKPAGVPRRLLAEVVLTVDEFEALRLADHECLYQQQAADRMGVSRQTLGRIVESARRKVAKALVEGCAIRIEGGEVTMTETRIFECGECGNAWEVPFGVGRPSECPACGGTTIRRHADSGAEPTVEEPTVEEPGEPEQAVGRDPAVEPDPDMGRGQGGGGRGGGGGGRGRGGGGRGRGGGRGEGKGRGRGRGGPPVSD